MQELSNLSEYIEEFQFKEANLSTHPVIQRYIVLQVRRLQDLMSNLSSKNFWKEAPAILGIDCKLALLRELLVTIEYFDFTDEEILNIIE